MSLSTTSFFRRQAVAAQYITALKRGDIVVRISSMAILMLGCVVSSAASAQAAIKLPSGKTMNCKDAWALADGQFAKGITLLLPANDQDKQARRAKILADTTLHIAAVKKDWDKKSSQQKTAIRNEVIWYAAFQAIKLGADLKMKSTALDADTKRYAELASERSIVNLELVSKGTFGSGVSTQDAILIPFSTLISIANKGSIYGYALDAGVAAINVGALYGDLSITNEQFAGELSQLETLAKTMAERMTSTDQAAVTKFKGDLLKACPR